MTQYFYIAAPVKLPIGSYGGNPIAPDKPHIFETELDFTHLYFEGNLDDITNKRFNYCSAFNYKHQAACADNNHLPLKHEITGSSYEKKSLDILYGYLEEVIQVSWILELCTCVNGREETGWNKQKVSWSQIQNPYDLVMEDHDFWEITNT